MNRVTLLLIFSLLLYTRYNDKDILITIQCVQKKQYESHFVTTATNANAKMLLL